METVKPLNKQEEFICEIIWGGVPTDTTFIRNSALFQNACEQYQNGAWHDTEIMWNQLIKKLKQQNKM